MTEAFHILIVESNPQGLHSLTDMLAGMEISITTAVSARETFSHVFRNDFNMIILSLRLPNTDGYSIAAKIRNRERSRDTPILLLHSREGNESLISKGYALGKVDSLSKPISPELLRAKVSPWIESWRQSRRVPQFGGARGAIIAAPAGKSNLESKEAMHRAAIDGMQDSAILWENAHGFVVGSNAIVRRILGYEEQEILGMHASQFFCQEDRDAGIPETELREAREYGGSVDDRWHQRKDGSRVWAVGLVTPLWKTADELEGYIKILRDRTDQKIKDDLARDTEDRYKNLLDSTVEGIFGFDVEGMCTFANASCLKLLGFSGEHEILGLDLHDIILHTHPEGAFCQGKNCPILAKILGGEETHGEASFLRPGRIPFEVENRIHAVRSDGLVIGGVVTFLDISDRKRAEERYKTLEKHLQQAKKLESLGRLAGGVAHQLNNDLTAILGFGELLLNHLESRDLIREETEEILQSGKRAAELVRKLLAFAGKQPVSPKPIPLESFLKERLGRFKDIAGEKVQLTLNLDPDLPQVYSEPEKLEQALLGILANSKEAILGEGTLSISARRMDLSDPAEAEKVFVRPGIYDCLSIKDTGHGLAEETKERLFDPFFSTKEMGRSAVGLGLSSAYGFIKQCGGTINVESEPDRGTLIQIFLPTHPDFCNR